MRRIWKTLNSFKCDKGLQPQNTENYSTKSPLKLSEKYSNDGANKNHGHVGKENCIKLDCEKKRCLTLCEEGKDTEILGHHTHKPPVGRMAKRISDTDAKGNNKPQWFVRNNSRRKISEQERQQQSAKDIKSDPKHQGFINTHNEKYD